MVYDALTWLFNKLYTTGGLLLSGLIALWLLLRKRRKYMSQQVVDEMRRLKGKSDEDIVRIFMEGVLNPFPSTILIKAVDAIMSERNITVTNIFHSVTYINSKGVEDSIILKSKEKG
jgi:hypothetical protein